MKRKLPRRDRVYALGRMASHLTYPQGVAAWQKLIDELYALCDPDTHLMPKFEDLYQAIRRATIHARKL